MQKQREEAEDFARLLLEATQDITSTNLTQKEMQEAFVREVAPMLLRWERKFVNPYIERILELDEDICALKAGRELKKRKDS